MVAANTIKNTNGDITAEVFIVRDINLRKQFEEHLKNYNEKLEKEVQERIAEIQRTEQRFKAMIENSDDLISVMDENRKIIYRSPAAARITGRANNEIVDIDTFKTLFDEQGFKEMQGHIKKAMENPGMPVFSPFRFLNKDGSYKEMEGTVTNFLHNESIRAIVFNARDISERKRAEQKLVSSERRFRALIEKAHDVITLMDSSFRIIYRSPSSERTSGWSNEEMLNRVATENMHPDDVEEARSIAMQALANPGVTFKSLFRNRHKDGHYIWLEGLLTNWLHDENVQAIVFNSQDVTERIEAAERIAASEERFRNTLDRMIEGVQILNKDLRYLYVNDAVAKQAGQPKEELMGQLVADLYPGVEQTELYKNIRRCIDEQVAIQLEDKFVFPDKRVKDFKLSLQPVPEGIFILSVDITDRKNAEKDLLKSLQEEELLASKLSVILNTLPATIALLDADGVIADVNEGWKKFADENDFKGERYGIGQNYIDMCEGSKDDTESDGKIIAQGIRAVLQKEKTEFEFEYPCHAPDEERWYRMIVSPLQHKTYHGAVVMHIDITDLKRMERERLKAKTEEQRNITRAMLEGQEKERNQIGRDLHDNIVQLMAATKMKLGVFLSVHTDGAPMLNQSMQHLQEALTEARNLSHQMVTPRFTSGTFIEELEKLLSDYSNDKRTASLHISKLDESAIPLRVKETLYRIAQEQLHNIDKYAQATEVNLELNIQGDRIYMTISDNGVGFDTTQQRKGIGLTNIYNRAESYAGHAIITSQPGHGCKLYIEIPL